MRLAALCARTCSLPAAPPGVLARMKLRLPVARRRGGGADQRLRIPAATQSSGELARAGVADGGAVVGKDLRNNLFHFFTILYEKISLEMSFGLENSLIIYTMYAMLRV